MKQLTLILFLWQSVLCFGQKAFTEGDCDSLIVKKFFSISELDPMSTENLKFALTDSSCSVASEVLTRLNNLSKIVDSEFTTCDLIQYYSSYAFTYRYQYCDSTSSYTPDDSDIVSIDDPIHAWSKIKASTLSNDSSLQPHEILYLSLIAGDLTRFDSLYSKAYAKGKLLKWIDECSTSSKTYYGIQLIGNKSKRVNGLGLSLNIFEEKKVFTEVNGAKFSFSPLRILGAGMAFPYLAIAPFKLLFTNEEMSNNPTHLLYKQRVNGIKLGFFDVTDCEVNGVSVGVLFNNATISRGISIAGIGNGSYANHGVMISCFLNVAVIGSGLQLGILNSAFQYRGIQIGLINRIGKRVLPLINIGF